VARKRSRPAQPRHHGKAAPAKRRWVRPGTSVYGFGLGRAAGSVASAETWTAPTVARAPNQSATIRMSLIRPSVSVRTSMIWTPTHRPVGATGPAGVCSGPTCRPASRKATATDAPASTTLSTSRSGRSSAFAPPWDLPSCPVRTARSRHESRTTSSCRRRRAEQGRRTPRSGRWPSGRRPARLLIQSRRRCSMSGRYEPRRATPFNAGPLDRPGRAGPPRPRRGDVVAGPSTGFEPDRRSIRGPVHR
jgi:hypothetical protein